MIKLGSWLSKNYIDVGVFIIGLFCVAVLLSTLFIPQYGLGDINRDGEVSISDLVIVNRQVNGKNDLAYDLRCADMDNDGHITEADVSMIEDIILGR